MTPLHREFLGVKTPALEGLLQAIRHVPIQFKDRSWVRSVHHYQKLAFPDQYKVQVPVIMGFAVQHNFPVIAGFNRGVLVYEL